MTDAILGEEVAGDHVPGGDVDREPVQGAGRGQLGEPAVAIPPHRHAIATYRRRHADNRAIVIDANSLTGARDRNTEVGNPTPPVPTRRVNISACGVRVPGDITGGIDRNREGPLTTKPRKLIDPAV